MNINYYIIFYFFKNKIERVMKLLLILKIIMVTNV